MNVDRIREVSDAATIDRLHGEPANDFITTQRAEEALQSMSLDEILKDVIDVWDVIDEMPPCLKALFAEHTRNVALPKLIKANENN